MIRAGHYLGVPPWELMELPLVWTQWANAVMNAENQAQMERWMKVLCAGKKG